MNVLTEYVKKSGLIHKGVSKVIRLCVIHSFYSEKRTVLHFMSFPQDCDLTKAADAWMKDNVTDFQWKKLPNEKDNTELSNNLNTRDNWLPPRFLKFLPPKLQLLYQSDEDEVVEISNPGAAAPSATRSKPRFTPTFAKVQCFLLYTSLRTL
jgi:hypothetical protein